MAVLRQGTSLATLSGDLPEPLYVDDSTSPAPKVNAPLRGVFEQSRNAVLRAVAWAFVRSLIGLLAAGILVSYMYTDG